MDLFQDFSFSKPSQHTQQDVVDEIEPVGDISPGSSRSASPYSSSSYFSPNPSLMDLSNTTEEFPSYDIDEFPSAYPTTPISSRLLGMQRKRSNATKYFDTVRQRRQSAVRLQCNPHNAANIRSYVERFLSEREGSPTSQHPSSINQTYLPPPTSAPREDLNLTSAESSSEDDEAEAFKALSLKDRPTNSDRRVSGSGRQKSYAVQKSAKGRTKQLGRS
ncbi:hypothetical protein MMC10_009218 [Thelotrema lepadinum]|nr:hypothetical protein [Thelotrema lepadinum]